MAGQHSSSGNFGGGGGGDNVSSTTRRLTAEDSNQISVLKAPFALLSVGPSQSGVFLLFLNSTFSVLYLHFSGKSHFCRDIIRHRQSRLSKPVDKVYYFYDVFQTRDFDDLENELGDDIEFIQGQCTTEWLNSNIGEAPTRGRDSIPLIVTDDLDSQLTRDTELIFTNHVHHQELAYISIFHQLYANNASHRAISNNATYLHLTPNKRDRTYLSVLSRQINGPGYGRPFMKMFEFATETLHDKSKSTKTILM